MNFSFPNATQISQATVQVVDYGIHLPVVGIVVALFQKVMKLHVEALGIEPKNRTPFQAYLYEKSDSQVDNELGWSLLLFFSFKITELRIAQKTEVTKNKAKTEPQEPETVPAPQPQPQQPEKEEVKSEPRPITEEIEDHPAPPVVKEAESEVITLKATLQGANAAQYMQVAAKFCKKAETREAGIAVYTELAEKFPPLKEVALFNIELTKRVHQAKSTKPIPVELYFPTNLPKNRTVEMLLLELDYIFSEDNDTSARLAEQLAENEQNETQKIEWYQKTLQALTVPTEISRVNALLSPLIHRFGSPEAALCHFKRSCLDPTRSSFDKIFEGLYNLSGRGKYLSLPDFTLAQASFNSAKNNQGELHVMAAYYQNLSSIVEANWTVLPEMVLFYRSLWTIEPPTDKHPSLAVLLFGALQSKLANSSSSALRLLELQPSEALLAFLQASPFESDRKYAEGIQTK